MTHLRLVSDDLPDSAAATFTVADVVTIGRSGHCRISLPKERLGISRVHAEIRFEHGGWYLRDKSSAGTRVDGVRVPSDEAVRLPDGARLNIGPYCLRVELLGEDRKPPGRSQEESFDLSISRVDLAHLDPQRVLHSALELPTRLAEARGESDVFAVACQYLVVTLAPILASAYVLLPPRDDEVSPEIIASYPDGPGLRVSAEMPAPAISRRVVAQLDKEPESVVFLSRAHPADNLDVTVAMTVKSLGACRVEQGADGRPVLLYALGEHGLLGGDRLVGEYLKLVSTLTRQHLLTLRRARMSKYFSPKVVELLMQGSGAAATRSAPEVAVSTTLFFDLRGFSLSVEAAASDLLELQEDLSAVITLVTQTVFERGGTVIDYQGDAVFAAWGVPFAQPDQALLAAQCALEVMHRLAHAPVRKLTPNKAGRTAMCGIGLCKGDVVAGTIGSRELFKFGVLGPSVNVSKRLESLSKPARLNAPILCCEGLARELQEAGARVRRVAQVRLEGMHRIEQVYELIDERAPSERGWGVEHDGRWNGVLSALESARSIEAVKALEPGLEQLPPEHPRTHWIRNLCLRLQSPEAIAEWDGIIRQ